MARMPRISLERMLATTPTVPRTFELRGTREVIRVDLLPLVLPSLDDREHLLPLPMPLESRVAMWHALSSFGAAGAIDAVRGGAARTWFRIFPERTLQQHRFKQVFFQRFLPGLIGKKVGVPSEELIPKAIDQLRRIGKQTRVRRRQLDTVVTKMHFNNSGLELTAADQQRAAAFWDTHGAEVVATEQKFFDDHGISHGATIGHAVAVDLNRRLRRRLQRFRTLARNEGVSDDAVDLEAAVRMIEAESAMHSILLKQLEPDLDEAGKAVYRFLHMTSQRTADGLFVPVPLSYSAPVRSALEFFGGFIKEYAHQDAWIVPDLLAVLCGASPKAPDLIDAVDIADGFTFAFDRWVDVTRETQLEVTRNQRMRDRKTLTREHSHGFNFKILLDSVD